MRHRFLARLSVVACSLAICLLPGCTTTGPSLVDAGMFRLEKQSSGKIYIAWSDAYEHEKGLVVSGVLMRRDRVGLPIRTRVNVSILALNGTLITEGQSPDMHVPRRITGKGQSPQRFSVHFAQTPPPGSLIRVQVPAP